MEYKLWQEPLCCGSKRPPTGAAMEKMTSERNSEQKGSEKEDEIPCSLGKSFAPGHIKV